MVLLTRIYTRGGDQGRTSLGDGPGGQACARVEAYGNVDEANADDRPGAPAAEGCGRGAGADPERPVRPGADSADRRTAPSQHLRIAERQVERLEQEIDQLNADLRSSRSHLSCCPGGTPAAAFLHLARTVAGAPNGAWSGWRAGDG